MHIQKIVQGGTLATLFAVSAQAIDINAIQQFSAGAACTRLITSLDGKQLFLDLIQDFDSSEHVAAQSSVRSAFLQERLEGLHSEGERLNTPLLGQTPLLGGFLGMLTSVFGGGIDSEKVQGNEREAQFVVSLRMAADSFGNLARVLQRLDAELNPRSADANVAESPALPGFSTSFDFLFPLWFEQRLAFLWADFEGVATGEHTEIQESKLAGLISGLAALEREVVDFRDGMRAPQWQVPQAWHGFLRAAARSRTRELARHTGSEFPRETEAEKSLMALEASRAIEDKRTGATISLLDLESDFLADYAYFRSQFGARTAVSLMRVRMQTGESTSQILSHFSLLSQLLDKATPSEVAIATLLTFELRLNDPTELVARLRSLKSLSQGMPGLEGDLPISALLVLLSKTATETPESLMNRYFKLFTAQSQRGAENGLNETAMAWLATQSGTEGKTAGVLQEVEALRTSARWGSFAPSYSDESWSLLWLLGARYRLSPDELADLCRRISEARGKVLESGRLMTVLAVLLEREPVFSAVSSDRPDRPLPGSIITQREIALYASVPYLRMLLPIEDLRHSPQIPQSQVAHRSE